MNIYKKTLIVLLINIAIFSFVSCNNDNGNSDSNGSDEKTSNIAIDNSNNERISTDTSVTEQDRNTDTSKNKTYEKVEDRSKNVTSEYQFDVGNYKLGINVSDLKKRLKKDGYKISLPPDYDHRADQYGASADPIRDGRIYQYDESYLFYTKLLTFYFTNKDKNYAIEINNNQKTNQNIGIGDTKADMIKTYGNEFIKKHHMYEYYDGKTYLSFIVEKDKIIKWSISSLPMDFNAP